MNKAFNIIAGCLLAVLLTACAGDRIIVDRRGVDMEQYEKDLLECESYAQEVEVGERVAKSAAVGSAVGGLIGAAVGNSNTAGRLAGAGAVKGGTSGLLGADRERRKVVKNCLTGRGYRILN